MKSIQGIITYVTTGKYEYELIVKHIQSLGYESSHGGVENYNDRYPVLMYSDCGLGYISLLSHEGNTAIDPYIIECKTVDEFLSYFAEDNNKIVFPDSNITIEFGENNSILIKHHSGDIELNEDEVQQFINKYNELYKSN
jgi:hypothetical protein